MPDLPTEVIRYCMRCREDFTKDNDKCPDCPFCLTCHIIGAVAH